MWEGEISLPILPPWTELSVLAGLDESVLRSTCRRRHFARGEVVFHEGDPAGAVHLVDRGRAAISLTAPTGDVVTVDVLQRGDTFGEQALVDRAAVRSATVTALEKLETLAMDVATAERLRLEHPGIDRFLLTILSARLRATNQQLLEALYLPAEVRVFRCLCRLAAVFESDSRACIPLTQNDIGSMTGISRSTVSRLLRQAQVDGIIVVTRSRLEVRDVATLRRRARLRQP